MFVFRNVNEKKQMLKRSETRLREEMDHAAELFEPAGEVIREVKITFIMVVETNCLSRWSLIALSRRKPMWTEW